MLWDICDQQWKYICASKVTSFYNLFSQTLIESFFFFLGLRIEQLSFYEIGFKEVLQPQRMSIKTERSM